MGAADWDGDQLAELLTAPGPGHGPLVRAFKALPGLGLLDEFFAYEADFPAGVFVGGTG